MVTMVDASILAKLPSMRPPPGVMPNFDNPYSLEKWVITCAAVCLSTTTLFVGIRLYTKSVVTKTLDWADYTCCIAWVGLIVDCALGLRSLDYGLGVHQWNVPLLHITDFLKLLYAMEIIFGPIIFFTELSTLLLYSKIFVVNRRSITFALMQLILWANLLFYIAMTFACIFNCSPVSKFWNRTIPGKCVSSYAIILSSAIFNVVSNFATVFLPVHAIWQLQMRTKRKIGVSAVFMAGLFACFASVMRLHLTVKDGDKPDVTYNMTAVMLWTVAEIATGLICGCLPIMPQFIHHSVTKFSSIASRTRNTKYFGRFGSSNSRPTLPIHERKPLPKRSDSLDLKTFESTLNSDTSSTGEAYVPLESDGHHIQQPSQA